MNDRSNITTNNDSRPHLSLFLFIPTNVHLLSIEHAVLTQNSDEGSVLDDEISEHHLVDRFGSMPRMMVRTLLGFRAVW